MIALTLQEGDNLAIMLNSIIGLIIISILSVTIIYYIYVRIMKNKPQIQHAVDAITKGMRIDLVDTPIRVSTVDPGLVKTEFSIVRVYGDKDRAMNTYKGYKPLLSEDIADTVVWVASRPEHVQVAEVIIFPNAQASSMVVHKELE